MFSFCHDIFKSRLLQIASQYICSRNRSNDCKIFYHSLDSYFSICHHIFKSRLLQIASHFINKTKMNCKLFYHSLDHLEHFLILPRYFQKSSATIASQFICSRIRTKMTAKYFITVLHLFFLFIPIFLQNNLCSTRYHSMQTKINICHATYTMTL